MVLSSFVPCIVLGPMAATWVVEATASGRPVASAGIFQITPVRPGLHDGLVRDGIDRTFFEDLVAAHDEGDADGAFRPRPVQSRGGEVLSYVTAAP